MTAPIAPPIYQMLDVKLATYIELASKIQNGGVFVCCSDTIELYTDGKIPWQFPETG